MSAAAELAAGDFFALIGEGAGLLKTLNEDSPDFFPSLARVREIILLIGGEVAPAEEAPALPASITVDVSNPEATFASLTAYLGSPAFNALKPWQQAYEWEAMLDIARLVGRSFDLVRSRLKDAPFVQDADEAYEAFTGNALPLGFDRQEVATKVDEAKEALKNWRGLPEVAAMISQRDALSDRANAAWERAKDANKARAELVKQMGDSAPSDVLASVDASIEQAVAEYQSAMAEYQAFMREQDSISSGFRQAAAERIYQDFDGTGGKVIADLIEHSHVTAAEATEWAGRQEISDGAARKLRKLGYPPEKMREDMAQFYRMVGGKLPNVDFELDGRGRANAKGIDADTERKAIALGSHFNKSVLWHEMGHQIEYDLSAKHAANKFLMRRRESDKLYTLRSLTGNPEYGKDEVAWRDSWLSPYIGKRYRSGVTEVFSMGLEYLANPIDAAMLAAKDPEMFALITGYVRTPHNPAMKAKLQGNTAAVAAIEAKQQSAQQKYDDAIAELAATVELTHPTMDEWLAESESWFRGSHYIEASLLKALRAKNYWGGIRGGMPADVLLVGVAPGSLAILSGKFKKSTGRVGKAFLAVWFDGGEPRRLIELMRTFDTLEEAKAWAALYRENGTSAYTPAQVISTVAKIRGEA